MCLVGVPGPPQDPCIVKQVAGIVIPNELSHTPVVPQRVRHPIYIVESHPGQSLGLATFCVYSDPP